MATRTRTAKVKTPKAKSSPSVDAADLKKRIAAALGDAESASAVLSLIDDLTNERDALAADNAWKELRIQQLTLLVYGRKTEKLSKDELAQLALAFGAEEGAATQGDPIVPRPTPPADHEDKTPSAGQGDTQAPEKEKKKRRPKSKTTIGPDVERIIDLVTVSPEDRLCTCCNQEMAVIGHVDHSTLEFIPAKLVQRIERREKLACRDSACRGDIYVAPRSTDPAVRRAVDESLLTQLVVNKAEDALPIDRQRDQFQRLGVTFPLNTLYSYWNYVTALLLPVAMATLAQVLGDSIVGIDDTKLRVLDKKRKGGSYKGCLWCFTSGTRELIAYTFTESWEAEAIAPSIAAINGHMQVDDYKGYGSTVPMPDGSKRILVDPNRRLGCMMHVRRRFYDAMQLGDKRAGPAIKMIHDIYDVEEDAKANGLDPGQRLALREERSVPVLDNFERWVDEMKPKCTPKSPLGKALGYAANQRVFVRRCFSDGRFEIDNGHTERAIRRPCIGRNNYLFTGSPEAAKRLAGAYTLVQSCRALGIDVRTYLIDVIRKLEADWPLRRLGELVPDRWAVLHGPGATGQQSAE